MSAQDDDKCEWLASSTATPFISLYFSAAKGKVSQSKGYKPQKSTIKPPFELLYDFKMTYYICTFNCIHSY